MIDHLTQQQRLAVGGQRGDLEFVLLRKFAIKYNHTDSTMICVINRFSLICVWKIVPYSERWSIHPPVLSSLSIIMVKILHQGDSAKEKAESLQVFY